MNPYNQASFAASRAITQKYSTSFGMATMLFPADMRRHIYNIYGLVRLADEIADTYRGKDALKLLDALEQEVYDALKRKYSTNVLVQSFMVTANLYGINRSLIKPFFASMRMDILGSYTPKNYKTYIYGSAEVVGLMCLKVFCQGSDRQYKKLKGGARALGSAFQKINFLRDIAADNELLGRMYFKGVTFDDFAEKDKQSIIADIRRDLAAARRGIVMLPPGVRPAVMSAYNYYQSLLKKIEQTPATVLKQRRIRIPNAQKLASFAATLLREGLRGRHESA